MRTPSDLNFRDLVEQHLGSRLPEGLAASVSMENLPDETQRFIVRMLALMKRSGYSVTEFNPHLLHWFSVTVPGTLPGAWGGRIPPLTMPGRHKKLDDYVADDRKDSIKESHLFVDIGCGFPPVTSADTAKRFPDWKILGVDRSFADYVLYDSDGHYACFDQEGNFIYFQALMNASGRALYADPTATQKRFITLFEELSPMMQPAHGTGSQAVEKYGNKLVNNHIRDFETKNLTFVNSDFTELKLKDVHVIRCMNVLIYYDPEDRKQFLEKARRRLVDGGLLITGTNGLGVQTRYTVYRKKSDKLVPDELAFGLDNIGHIVFMPFFSIQDDDPETNLLADLAGIIRNDRSFWPDFSKRQDDLLQQNGICQRNSNGFFEFLSDNMSTGEYLKINSRIWQEIGEEGYIEQAVDVIAKSGYEAWKNSVGDIAVKLPA